MGPQSSSSMEATEAAKTMYAPQDQMSPQCPQGPDRTSSSSAAAAAAAAMMGPRTPSQRDQYQRASSDYPRLDVVPGILIVLILILKPAVMAHLPKPQLPTQPSYNPAAYAQVSGYPPTSCHSLNFKFRLPSNRLLRHCTVHPQLSQWQNQCHLPPRSFHGRQHQLQLNLEVVGVLVLIISISLLFLVKVTSVKSCWRKPSRPKSSMPLRC